jgi:hypothetical protein
VGFGASDLAAEERQRIRVEEKLVWRFGKSGCGEVVGCIVLCGILLLTCVTFIGGIEGSWKIGNP